MEEAHCALVMHSPTHMPFSVTSTMFRRSKDRKQPFGPAYTDVASGPRCRCCLLARSTLTLAAFWSPATPSAAKMPHIMTRWRGDPTDRPPPAERAAVLSRPQ